MGIPTYSYSIDFNDLTCVFEFTFHTQNSWTYFARQNISLPAGSVKSSLTCTGDVTFNMTVTSLLSGISSFGNIGAIQTFFDVPLPNLITNYLFLDAQNTNSSSSSPFIVIELFNEVEVDGYPQPIIQNLGLLDGQVLLQLTFPSFTSSLYYDPNYQLARLVEGSNGDGDGDGEGSDGDGGSNLTLVVATSVVIPVAVLLVIILMVVGLVIFALARRKRRAVLLNLRKDVEMMVNDE